MSKLLQRANLSASDGKIHSITPETANWSYVGFDVYKIEAGATVSHETLGNEVCLVLISGLARVSSESVDFGIIGARNSPFDSLPWSVYVPAKSSWHLQALTALEFTVCKAP
ncbi:MAG: 5-deoxy-glucuronate isomerase, partial [Dolichospermum sp.]